MFATAVSLPLAAWICARIAAVGGTPVMRVYSSTSCCSVPAAAGCDVSAENSTSAQSAPATGARASRAPLSLIGVLVSIALVYSQHDCGARGPDYTEPLNTS